MTTNSILKIALLSALSYNVSAQTQHWSLNPQNDICNANYGNVGVGTSSPSALLEINGNSQTQVMGVTSEENGCISQPILKVVSNSAGEYYSNCQLTNILEVGKDEGFGVNTQMVVDNHGNLGVGNNITPTNKLDVDGTIRMRQGAQAGFIPISDQDGNMTWTKPSSVLTANLWAQNNDTVYARSNNLSVSIGTSKPRPGYKLSVNGAIVCSELRVLEYRGWDKVFEPDYNLRPLSEVKAFIDENHHLPDIKSADDYENGGIELSQMNGLLLRKIEELTLYLIQLEEELEDLQAKQ